MYALCTGHLEVVKVDVKLNQVTFIYITQNHNHIASGGFTSYTICDSLCP